VGEGRAEVPAVNVVTRTTPPRQRLDVRLAVAGAELQLVADVAGVEERRRVGLELPLRPLRLIEVERVVVDAEHVEEVGGVLAALGNELEAAVHDGVQAGEVEVGVEDVGVLELGSRRLLAVVRLVPGGLLRAERTGVAADLRLLALQAEHRGGVVRRDLGVELDVLRLQLGLVGHVGDGPQVDLLVAIRAPDPQTVLDDRTAELGAVLFHLIDLVALLDGGLGVAGAVGRVTVVEAALVERALVNVGAGLPGLVRLVVATGAAPLVRAALGHHVEDDAAGGDRRVAAARRHLHLFERVEVVVGGRRAQGRHVGDDHAVDRPDGLVAAGAGADIPGLLAALVTTDVDAVGENARSRLQDGPGVASGRDLLELRVADRGARGDAALVQQRGLAQDRDDVLDRGREGHFDLGVATDVDGHVRVLDGREPFQLSLELVRGRAQAQEVEDALGVRDLELAGAVARQGYSNPRQGAALLVDDGAVEVAGLQLSEGGPAS